MTTTDPAEFAPTCSQCGDALGDIAAECVDCSALLCSADCEDTHACLPQSAPSATETADPAPEQVEGSGEAQDALARQVEDLRQQLVTARQETARVRSQLAEAREALARVAATLGWDVRPEQVPSGIPDLAIAVQALRHERDQARAVLAEAREQRDEASEALVRAETDLWIAEDLLHWLRAELDQYATQMERAADFAAKSGAWSGQIIALYKRHADRLRRMLTATAPETAPESPQTDEQTPVWADTHTGAETGSQGPLDTAAVRARWLAPCGPCDAGYPTACTCPTADPRAIIAALAAEIDQLRAEWSALRGQVGRAIVLCGPRGDKPIDVIVASVIDDLEEARQENADLRAQLAEARADLAKLWDATGIPSDADMHLEDVADTIRRMAHDDRAIRRLLRDHGVSVGGDDPLPAVVAETLDGVRKVNTALADLRYGLANALEMVDIPDDDAIIRTVARLRAALGTTPDTRSTT